MDSYKNIEKKLLLFVSKYYTNELIKGGIMFLSLGILYLFFTLFLEYFLWLKPSARTVLFGLFVLVELLLFLRFIFFPVFKLIGLQKGITFKESSRIIGDHFPEVKDKLLNVLQLKENSIQSDLLLASIEQKSKDLQAIPFLKAIDFKRNWQYLKYAIIPVLIWLITLLSGNNVALKESLDRVVNFKTAYSPPAPFTFLVMNEDMHVVQGKPFTVFVKAVGRVIPEEAKIVFNSQQYYLQNTKNGLFSYTFSEIKSTLNFYIESNGVRSQNFQIQLIYAPIITNVSMNLDFPKYLKRRDEIVKNSGNITVPQGTKITWNVAARQTDVVSFLTEETRIPFTLVGDEQFVITKTITQNMGYQISSSNKNLKDFEKLQFSVGVIKDQFPTIDVKSNMDSISNGAAQFAGRISDDYGISKLELVYYDVNIPETQKFLRLEVNVANIQTFFYSFPDRLNLTAGVHYELFFQVFDNDVLNGNKRSLSRKFNYLQKTKDQIEEESLQEQRSAINNLENTINQQKDENEYLRKMQFDIQDKKEMNWNDKKKVESFLKSQEQYNKISLKQTNKLLENLDEKKEENQRLQYRKEELKKRLEEIKKRDKQQSLLEEIQKMAEKLNKEDLLEKAKELAQQNKQQERSLSRILELTKRFYVEQKTMQIANKIKELAKRQERIAKQEDSSIKDQKEIKAAFKSIESELKELEKDNQKLKEPMELGDFEDEKEAIVEELEKAETRLTDQNALGAKESQKKASQKMKEMSQKMQKSLMEMEADSIEENMDDLRKILENLVTFSFKQEELMDRFNETSTTHPDFGDELKRQNEIKTYFEHIDDSLYVLSMRLPKISAKIQDDLATVHYNLEQSLNNFSENRFPNGISNQRYVMTSANNLADYLSEIMSSMKNSMSMGKGKSGESEFSLPDLIQKQEGLSKKMEQGMKKGGEKPGDQKGEGKTSGDTGEQGDEGENGKEGNQGNQGKNGKSGGKESEGGKNSNGSGGEEDMNGELYRIYQEQSILRQQLQEAINQMESTGGVVDSQVKRALKSMEQLENELLEKGFSAATLQKMQRVQYELLKLDKASLEQGRDKKRKSISSADQQQKLRIKELTFKKLFYTQMEILNRQSLPLQPNYKKKVQVYFSDSLKVKNE
jgi:hypothetical protein